MKIGFNKYWIPNIVLITILLFLGLVLFLALNDLNRSGVPQIQSKNSTNVILH